MKNTQFPDFKNSVKRTLQSFSFIEKMLFYIFLTLLILSTLILLGVLNNKLLVTVPAHGGSFTEGIVGFPRFANPVLELSNADHDVTELVYGGLMKATHSDALVPELATEHPSISEDGTTYTFTLRNDAVFHDGEPVTADDVVFTIERIQNPDVKSPQTIGWDGVRVEKVDERIVRFVLDQVYQPFLENTTIGILPEHIWKSIPPDQMLLSTHNIEPVGAGPFRITKTKRNKDGIVTNYELEAFSDYALDKPYLDKLTLLFYNNKEELLKAFEKGEVDALHGITPEELEDIQTTRSKLYRHPLPRIFGVFFNQNQADIFTDEKVREALDAAVNKELIIQDALEGYGVHLDGPLPPSFNELDDKKSYADLSGARGILNSAGWELGEDDIYTNNDGVQLGFTLTTANTPELRKTAELLQSQWERLGVRVELEFFDVGVLTNDIIRPREYEALLFGHIVGRDNDLFPFWHSSQRNDPGLNIALYANITVDDILENVRVTFDDSERRELLGKFSQEIKADTPAIFLYTPEFTYLVDEDIKNIQLGTIVTPADRFLTIHTWFIETDRVWSIFAKQN